MNRKVNHKRAHLALDMSLDQYIAFRRFIELKTGSQDIYEAQVLLKNILTFYQPWDGSDDDDDVDDKTKVKYKDKVYTYNPSPMNGPWNDWGRKEETLTTKECYHEWKDYMGLNERFKFCTKCDKKDGQ